MKKTLLALVLVLALVLPTMALGVELNEVGTYPIPKEPVTLTAVNQLPPICNDFNDVWVLNEYEKLSGVDVQWTGIPAANRAEQLNLLLASLDLPDFMFKMDLSATQQAEYGSDGVLVDLAQYLDVMPNLSKWYEEYPTAKAALEQPDGKIYATSYILAGYAIRMGGRIYFNTDLMEKVGWDKVPTTVDELYDYLLACKEYDYNENGVADEIPLSTTSSAGNIGYIYNVLLGSYGLGNRGSSHPWADMGEDGTARFMWTTEGAKEMMAYIAKLYQAGLIDPDVFSNELPDLIAKAQEGRAQNYIFVNNTPVTGSKYEEYTLGMKEPFEGTDKLWYNYSLPASQGGEFVISYTCKEPELAARWADYWYSDEGILHYFMGEEGQTYEADADSPGGYKLTDYVVKNPDGLNFEVAMAPWTVWAYGANPSVATNEFFKGGETWPCSLESAAGLINYVPEEIWPPFVFDSETSTELNTLKADFSTYRDEWLASFMTGSKSLESDWEEYISGFNAIGVDRFLEITNAAIESYGVK